MFSALFSASGRGPRTQGLETGLYGLSTEKRCVFMILTGTGGMMRVTLTAAFLILLALTHL